MRPELCHELIVVCFCSSLCCVMNPWPAQSVLPGLLECPSLAAEYPNGNRLSLDHTHGVSRSKSKRKVGQLEDRDAGAPTATSAQCQLALDTMIEGADA